VIASRSLLHQLKRITDIHSFNTLGLTSTIRAVLLFLPVRSYLPVVTPAAALLVVLVRARQGTVHRLGAQRNVVHAFGQSVGINCGDVDGVGADLAAFAAYLPGTKHLVYNCLK